MISPRDGFYNDDFDLYLINNGPKLPVVVYDSCWNNKFTEDPECLGWKTLSKPKGGGIATFGSSALCYTYNGTDSSSRRWGWIETHIFKELFNNKILGQTWTNVITGYINNFSSFEWDQVDSKTLISFMMFGDPTLVISDGDDPKDASAATPKINLIPENAIHEILVLYRAKNSEWAQHDI
jgi:hypothetical protein